MSTALGIRSMGVLVLAHFTTADGTPLEDVQIHVVPGVGELVHVAGALRRVAFRDWGVGESCMTCFIRTERLAP